jgi:hypothetical protein
MDRSHPDQPKQSLWESKLRCLNVKKPPRWHRCAARLGLCSWPHTSFFIHYQLLFPFSTLGQWLSPGSNTLARMTVTGMRWLNSYVVRGASHFFDIWHNLKIVHIHVQRIIFPSSCRTFIEQGQHMARNKTWKAKLTQGMFPKDRIVFKITNFDNMNNSTVLKNKQSFFSFIHMCIQGLGHFSPLPPPPPLPPTPPPPSAPTPSIPSRNYFALISNFVVERI